MSDLGHFERSMEADSPKKIDIGNKSKLGVKSWSVNRAFVTYWFVRETFS